MSDFTVNGTIEDIECFQAPEKVVLTIRPSQHQVLYIEFRGSRTKKAIAYSKGEHVEIPITYEGRRSKTGTSYNNIVGKSIKRYQPK